MEFEKFELVRYFGFEDVAALVVAVVVVVAEVAKSVTVVVVVAVAVAGFVAACVVLELVPPADQYLVPEWLRARSALTVVSGAKD